MNSGKSVFDMESNRLLNTKQAAEYLGYKVNYIYNLVSKGELMPLKCGGKKKGGLRFPKIELDGYLGKKENGY